MRILDTDICVEILRDNQQVKRRRRRTKGPVVRTWITVAELYYGAFKSAKPEKNRALVADLVKTLEVLPLDEPATDSGRNSGGEAVLEGHSARFRAGKRSQSR